MSDALVRIEIAATNSEAINLTQEIATYFVASEVQIHTPPALPRRGDFSFPIGGATVTGTLNLTHSDGSTTVAAHCSIRVSPAWRKKAPILRCSDKWIRGRERSEPNPSWHVNSDGTLCYMLDNEWADVLAEVEELHGVSAALATAAGYAINSVRWLLYRHLQGYRRKLVSWDPQWPQWPHYADGIWAYHREKLRNRKRK
jgi:hypothetical protein